MLNEADKAAAGGGQAVAERAGKRQPVHHPRIEQLLDYTAGNLPEPSALAIASHLVFCRSCHRQMSLFEAAAGVMLEDMGGAEISANLRDATLRMLEIPAAGNDDAPASPSPRDAPAPLALFGVDELASVSWTPIWPGIGYHGLDVQGGRAALIRLKPGKIMPRHTHTGQEFTLVLQGGYASCGQDFHPGDLESCDEETEHAPVALSGEDCIAMIATESPLILTGPVSRWFNPVFRF